MREQKNTRRQSEGFTLFELMITVSLTAILGTTGFITLGSYWGSQNLKKSVDQVLAVMHSVQKRSITQENGKRWGIRISKSAASVSQYSSFSGASFSTSTVDRTYGLKDGIAFSEPSEGFTYDALFEPITGTLSSKKIISLTNKRRDGLVGDIIFGGSGRVTKRNEKGVAGYWHFDESSSTVAYDASGLAHSGTFNGTPSWQSVASCVAGACLLFDGTSESIAFGNAASLQITNGTVEAWVNTSNAGSSYRGIVAKLGAYGMMLNSNEFGVYDWGASTWRGSGVSVNDGSWHHVACSFQSGVTNGTLCYVDGSLALTTTMTVSSQGAGLLVADTGADQFFSGSIDEVRVYNYVLSASDILNHYNDLH